MKDKSALKGSMKWAVAGASGHDQSRIISYNPNEPLKNENKSRNENQRPKLSSHQFVSSEIILPILNGFFFPDDPLALLSKLTVAYDPFLPKLYVPAPADEGGGDPAPAPPPVAARNGASWILSGLVIPPAPALDTDVETDTLRSTGEFTPTPPRPNAPAPWYEFCLP